MLQVEIKLVIHKMWCLYFAGDGGGVLLGDWAVVWESKSLKKKNNFHCKAKSPPISSLAQAVD